MANTLECLRSMAVRGPKTVNPCGANRPSLREKSSLNQLRSIAGSVRLADMPDVRLDNISEDQVLVWDTSNSTFVNATIGSIAVAPGTILIPNVKEFFIDPAAPGANNGNAGTSNADAVLDFDVALNLMSDFAVSYDLVQFWAKGDIDFHTDLSNRLREGSLVGNNEYGLIIRGCNFNVSSPIGTNDAPRKEGQQLVVGTTLDASNFTEDTALTGAMCNTGFGLNAWTSTATLDSDLHFIKSISSKKIYPIVVDDTTVDGVTPGQRIFLATSESNPSPQGSNWQTLIFPTKIMCSNTSTPDGILTNPAFNFKGNVQIIETHFVLQDGVVTPFHINGEFQISYSMFSNSVIEGASINDTTLRLSGSGYGSDANARTQLNSTDAYIAGGRIIRVYKSIFRDLIITTDRPCNFSDCVFIRCQFENCVGASFKHCTFFEARGSSLGDSSSVLPSTNNSISIYQSYIMYTKSQSDILFTLNNSSLNISESIMRPVNAAGSPISVSLFETINNSTTHLEKINVVEGLKQSGTHVDASFLNLINSTTTIRDLTLNGATSNSSYIVAVGSNVNIGNNLGETYWNTCTSNGPILYATESDIKLQSFAAVLPVGYAMTTSTLGVFNLIGCDVWVTSKFKIDTALSATVNLFHLQHSNLQNSKAGNSDSYFNLIAALDQIALVIDSSHVRLYTGEASVQEPLHGGCQIYNHSDVSIIGYTAGTWNINDNCVWDVNFTGGDHMITVHDNSHFSLLHIDLDSLTTGHVSRAVEVINNSTFTALRGSIKVQGKSGDPSIFVSTTSHTDLIDIIVQIEQAEGAAAIGVNTGSELYLINSDTTSSKLVQVNDCDEAIAVTHNSLLHSTRMDYTTNAPKGLVARGGSKIYCIGQDGSDSILTVTGRGSALTSVATAAIEGRQCSEIYISRVEAGASALTPLSGLILAALSKGYAEFFTKGTNIADEGVTLLSGSTLQFAETNDITTTLKLGTTTGLPYSTISTGTARILPDATFISTTDGSVRTTTQNCTVTGPTPWV